MYVITYTVLMERQVDFESRKYG